MFLCELAELVEIVSSQADVWRDLQKRPAGVRTAY